MESGGVGNVGRGFEAPKHAEHVEMVLGELVSEKLPPREVSRAEGRLVDRAQGYVNRMRLRECIQLTQHHQHDGAGVIVARERVLQLRHHEACAKDG